MYLILAASTLQFFSGLCFDCLCLHTDFDLNWFTYKKKNTADHKMITLFLFVFAVHVALLSPTVISHKLCLRVLRCYSVLPFSMKGTNIYLEQGGGRFPLNVKSAPCLESTGGFGPLRR